MKKSPFFIGLVFISYLFLFSSCLALQNAGKQKIKLNTSPQGASVTINGEDMYLQTPCAVSVKRNVRASFYNDVNEYRVLFTKQGYKDKEVIIKGQSSSALTTELFGVLGSRIKYKKEIFATLQSLDAKEVLTKKGGAHVTRLKDKLDNTPPEIEVLSPKIERGMKNIVSGKGINILGKVKDNSGIYEVTVNDAQATITPDGTFEAMVPLSIGQNKISIKATDGKMNTASVSFYVECIEQTEGLTKEEKREIDEFGTFYALIVAVQDYKDPFFNDLDQPVADATKLYNTLIRRYSFYIENVKFLKNPRREQITEALEYYYNNISNKDNLLVFYAGHGYWDSKFKQGYWLPSDAKENNRGTWLSNSVIRDYVRAIQSKHSLLITDACFAGGIFKSRDASLGKSQAIKQLYKLPSRKAMTSGAMNEVPDKSVFLEYLIKRLTQNEEKYLSSEQLFASFKIAVINNSQNGQVPQFGEISETGDEGGDFIFIKK